MFLLRRCSSRLLPTLDLVPRNCVRTYKALAVNKNPNLAPKTKSLSCFKDNCALFHINSEHELADPKPDPPILASLEQCMERDGLVWSTSLQKLRLRSVTKDLRFLHERGFPLPDSLTKQQWERLVGLLEKGHRNKYLDCIKRGEDEEVVYQELKEADKKAQKDLTFTKDTFKNVMQEGLFQEHSLEDKLHMINFVYQEMKDAGEVLPIEIKQKGLKELISLNDTRSIQNFFSYQAQIKTTKELDFVKKRVKNLVGKGIQEKVQAERANEQHIVYGLGHNVIMLKHYPRDMDRQVGWNAVREFHEWGQPLVIDLSFMGMMSYKNAKGMAYREITYSLLANREHPTPFQMHFTNYNEKCDKANLLFDLHPHLRDDPAFPAALSTKCHTELFDKSRLVYLTPDSSNELSTYNGDDIYVIGALNDRGAHAPYTLAQARKDGIRHARLPIKQYIGMSPELNIEAVIAMLLDFRQTKDWFFACRHVPARMLRNRWLSATDSARMEALYLAHGKLSPTTDLTLRGMSPNMYRQEYARLLAEYAAESGGEVKQFGIGDLGDREMPGRGPSRDYQNRRRPRYEDDGYDHRERRNMYGDRDRSRPRYDYEDQRRPRHYQDRRPRYDDQGKDRPRYDDQDQWRQQRSDHPQNYQVRRPRYRYEADELWRQSKYDARNQRRPRYDDEYDREQPRPRYDNARMGHNSDSKEFSTLKKESLDDLMKDN